MIERYAIHPRNPQERLLSKVTQQLRAGAIMAYPTDTTYALGCLLGNKQGMDRIRQIRGLDSLHDFSLICPDLSGISTYAHVDNIAFRLIKQHIPGPYTFILPATKAVPKAFMLPKKPTIGLRVPDSIFLSALLLNMGEVLVSVTLQLPNDDMPLTDPDEMQEQLGKRVDILVDGGAGGSIPSSIIDLTGAAPVVLRAGLGDISEFES